MTCRDSCYVATRAQDKKITICPASCDKINLKWNSILEERMIEKFTTFDDDMTQNLRLNS